VSTTTPVTEDTVAVDATAHTPPLPLAGIRVVDLTMVWAGPYGTKLLADLGAEVIKIEGPARTDLTRILTIPADREFERPFDASRYFNEYNRNKLGMAVDVQQASGRAIIRELATVSDVVIENFRPGVIKRLGFGYDELKKLNPRIIVVSLPGFSGYPPEASIPAYGPNIEQMGGLAYLNGYSGGPPHKSGISYGDPLAGLGGAAAVLLALLQRERTGLGQYVEVSQRNLLLGMIGDALVAHQIGAPLTRTGNRSTAYAPQGVYPAAPPHGTGGPGTGGPGTGGPGTGGPGTGGPGTGGPGTGGPVERATGWVALSVVTDGQWRALCRTMARDDLAADGELATVVGRMREHDRLDEAIAVWTRGRTADETAQLLQAAGVPAAPVRAPADLPRDANLVARDFFRKLPHPEYGEIRVTAPVWRFDGCQLGVRTAPKFGEHNREVLAQVLGYSADTIDALERDGVLADRPRQS
jgi:crotonobetainyl-CoA:carnitine CoA-transferase CaiB-like acyl-CoA transferase